MGRNGADVGTRWVVCGVGWVRAGEWVARESDAFLRGVGERMGRVWARVLRPGCALGRSGDIG